MENVVLHLNMFFNYLTIKTFLWENYNTNGYKYKHAITGSQQNITGLSEITSTSNVFLFFKLLCERALKNIFGVRISAFSKDFLVVIALIIFLMNSLNIFTHIFINDILELIYEQRFTMCS